MSDAFVGQILLFPFNFPPAGYAFCEGQLLAISQNQALFSLLGTMYGGDGRSNFALPNLQGMVSVGFGQGVGLSNYVQGDSGGVETVPLTVAQIASHTHTVDIGTFTAAARCKNGTGNQQSPVGTVAAIEAAGVTATYSNAAPDASMNAAAMTAGGTATAASAGSGALHNNLQPYLVLNYCIALQGIFPARS